MSPFFRLIFLLFMFVPGFAEDPTKVLLLDTVRGEMTVEYQGELEVLRGPDKRPREYRFTGLTVFKVGDASAVAENAHYDTALNQLTLLHGQGLRIPKIIRGRDVVQSRRIVWNLKTNTLKAEGGGPVFIQPKKVPERGLETCKAE